MTAIFVNLFGLLFAILASGVGIGLSLAITAMLISVGQVQGICDPTNTQNAWLAAELKVDVHTLLARTLPYAWALAFAGLIAGAIYYMA